MVELSPQERDEAAQMQQLQKLFRNMTEEVSILFVTDPVGNPEVNDLIRQILRLIRQLTDKITLREFPVGHEEAVKNGVTTGPALLFASKKFRVLWLGAPLGEEGRTLIELLLMLGGKKYSLPKEVEKVYASIKEKRDIKVFVSPTCPYCPQQTFNAIRALLERPGLFSLTIIDIQLHPSFAEKYKAFSVPQVWANETLIALGAQSEELFAVSLAKLEQQSFFIPEESAEELSADLVIVGGGPAGLTAGIYAKRSGLQTVVIEKGALGGQIATTPIVENYPGLTHVGGKTLVDILVNHALEYVKIFPDEAVLEIVPGESSDGRLLVKTSRRKISARAVLLATGAEHRKLEIPGERQFSGRGVSYCSTCDGPLFVGKKVVMIGGGNSALTEALHLKNLGVDVSIIHRRDQFRAQDYLVHNLQEASIPVFFDTEAQEILGDEQVSSITLKNNKTGKISKMPVNGVFISIGYEPAVDLARKAGIELDQNGYIKRDSRHRTNIKGIYSAGDVEGGYKQIVIAAGQGAEAAMAIFEDLINPYWKLNNEQENQ
ncbi:MAG: FAD-dependent oxidoreductase [Deltaproteobacteria bacterium]